MIADVRRDVEMPHEAARGADAGRQLIAIEETGRSLGEAFSRLTSSVNHALGPAGDAAAVPPRDADEALVAVCGVLARALGLSPVAQRTGSRASPPETVAGVARRAGFRVRRIVLRGAWWTHDAGPLLAFSRADTTPVALVPAGASSYDLVDPRQRRASRVTAATAQTIAPKAYAVYAVWASSTVGLRDMVRLVGTGCRRDLAVILILGVSMGLLATAVPIGTAVLSNSIIPGADRGRLLQWMLLVITCALASALLQVARGLATLRLEMRAGGAIQAAVWARLISLPLRFFRDYTAGALAVRAMGIDTIRQVISGGVIRGLMAGVLSIFSIALLFHYDAYAAAIATLLLGAFVAITIGGAWIQLKQHRAILQLRARTAGLVLQLLTGIGKIRVSGAEVRAFAVWARLFADQRRMQFQVRMTSNLLSVFQVCFPMFANVVLFIVILQTSAHGTARIGDVLAFLVAFGGCVSAAVTASGAAGQVLAVLPYYEFTRPIRETQPEPASGELDPGILTGAIAVDRLVFRYAADGPPVLNDVSFRVEPGEFVAFVGPSGSGKSTILRALLGFEAPQAGAVYIDGLDLRGLDVQAVRRQMGVVLQNGRLMPGDLFTNIVGCTAATVDDAWHAARLASLDADIAAMPMMMHTVVTDGGGTLSGGQRQRLMIARAVVQRPRILLLDEATSALDNGTQAVVCDGLARLKATRIVVAHRLSTIIKADRIFVVDGGRIVQTGTYGELAGQPGLFAELARRQVA